jgi:PAS domain S-box-containing protein
MSLPATPLAPRPWGVDYLVGFGLALLVLLASGLLDFFHTRRLRENEQWVAHTHEVIEQLYLTRATLRDAEASKRGYLLTGREAYLESFESQLADYDVNLKRLTELVADNSEQSSLVEDLRALSDMRVAELRRAVELAQGGDREAALEFIEADIVGGTMDAVMRKSLELRDAERELLELRGAESQASYRAAMLSCIGITLIGSLLVGCLFVMSHRNVAQRRRDAQLVADERERLQVTLASIGDAVIVTDAEGRITFMNAVAEQLTGWKSEAIGRSLTDIFLIFNEFTGERVESPVMKVLREGKIVGLANHTVLAAKDGTRRPIDDSGAPIRAGDQSIGGVVLVFRDVTERRLREHELRALAAHLSEADRRKDEFLAMLAHELRNPLAPIRNGLEILRLAGDPTEDARYAREVMDRQLDQMVRMVDDLLDVSRVTRNLLELRKGPVDLSSVVSSAVETSRPLLVERRHELKVSLPDEPVMLEADAARLAQVLANLLNNAAKYTEPGGRIELTAEKRDGEAVVTVRDDGIGIPAEMLPAVFTLFTQLDRKMERTHGGLGIGLTLVKRLVELHGGAVEARSEGPGRGSEFIVRLPLSHPVGAHAEAPAVSPSAQRKRRILVVDDNVDSASSLRLMLQMLGHEVELAHDGEAAVEKTCVYRPDLILLDLGLPKLNGYEACRKIRAMDGANGDEGAPRKVIVALTGWGQEDDRRRSHEAGFDLHLVKPIELAALQRLLADA